MTLSTPASFRLVVGVVMLSLATTRAENDEPFFKLASRVDTTSLMRTITALTSHRSRTTGYPGAVAVADWIESEWRRMGVGRLGRWAAPSVMPVDLGASIEVDGKKWPLHSVWPNAVRTSQTPPKGLSGALIYGKSGSYGDFDGLPVEGSIALVDFPGQLRWPDAFDLGANAVVFLAPHDVHRKEASNTFLTNVADLPRFYAPPETAQQLRLLTDRAPRAHILADMKWQRVRADVLLGLIEGHDDNLADQPIVLSAYYDAPSVIPALSPGAQAACGMAGMMEMVRALTHRPVARPVILMAMPGHFQAQNAARYVVAHLDSLWEGEFDTIVPSQLPAGTLTLDDVARLNPVTFVGLDLTTADKHIGFQKGGPPYSVLANDHRSTQFGDDAEELVATAQAYERLAHLDTLKIVSGVIRRSQERQYLGSTAAEAIPTDAAPFALNGWLAVTAVTGNDDRQYMDTPLDTPDRLNLPNLVEQVRFLVYLIRTFDGPRSDFPTERAKNHLGVVRGRVVRFEPTEGPFPNTPIVEAIVRPRMKMKSVSAVRGEFITVTDSDGRFVVPGMEYDRIYRSDKPFVFEAYGINPTTGAIEYVPDLGIDGDLRNPIGVRMDRRHMKVTVVAFRAQPATLYDIVDPRYLLTLDNMMVVEAGREAEPVKFGASLPLTPLEAGIFGFGGRKTYLGSDVEPIAVAFGQPGVRLKLVMTLGELGLGRRLVALNTDNAHPTGVGFDTDRNGRITRSAYQIGSDTHRLNGIRLDLLASHGIDNPRLQSMHYGSGELLEQARETLENREYGRFIVASRAAWGYTSRAYTDVRGTTDDVVHGVVFFLAMLLPFSYMVERLLIDARGTRGRILGATFVFTLAFLVLRWAHPAFSLAISPSVLLLSFIILALSLAVTGIAVSKFNHRLHQSLSEQVTNHTADVSRLGVFFTATRLGIGQMRRRPMRTGLTAGTIVILTFVVLSFTSIRSTLRFNKIEIGRDAPYNGLLVRLPNWAILESPVARRIEDRFRYTPGATTAKRVWRPARASAGARSTMVLRRTDGPTKSAVIQGLLGLSPTESQLTVPPRALITGRWFNEPDEQSCILSELLADRLEIGPQDVGRAQVTTLGGHFRVVGIIDSAAFTDVQDLNGEPITPLEPDAQQTVEQRTSVGMSRSGSASIYVHLKGDELVVVPAVWALRLGGTVRSVAVRLPDSQATTQAADEWMPALGINIYAGIDGARYVMRSVGLTSVRGEREVVIPIVLVVLIVTNTMLGAVYERTTQTGVLNAIGLAPAHVAGLFVAEAAVYSTIGAILGYLLGQVAATIITATGILPGLTLNYSSVSAVGTIVLVMAVVMSSSIWPAKLASQMCVPGIERSWTPPEPEGDLLRTPLPFMLSRRDADGVMPFLREYFEMYEDRSIGETFSTQSAALSTDPDTEMPHVLNVDVWLAPFDLGISQKLTLRTREDEEGMLAVDILMLRHSGGRDSWRRGCRALLNEIRRQFLVWRALTPETRDRYVDAPAA